jgi:hypothetical protein
MQILLSLVAAKTKDHASSTFTGRLCFVMMGTEMVPETSVSSYNQLTRLIAREDFIGILAVDQTMQREIPGSRCSACAPGSDSLKFMSTLP